MDQPILHSRAPSYFKEYNVLHNRYQRLDRSQKSKRLSLRFFNTVIFKRSVAHDLSYLYCIMISIKINIHRENKLVIMHARDDLR